MADDLPCLILEVSDAESWPPLHEHVSAKRIPQERRPVALQPDLRTAEQEALRLARRAPHRRFVIFEPVLVGATVTIPTHVNIRGEVKHSEQRATVMPIDDGSMDIRF